MASIELKELSAQKMFGGTQYVYEHFSQALNCKMKFGVFLPPQEKQGDVPALLFLSGLTCTEQNFLTKAGAQKLAAELGMALIIPDSSPRGEGVPDDEAYDLGQGAGFYLNATEEPWAQHFQMERYIIEELPEACREMPLSDWSISGHSMGGHGALTLHLKNPGIYKSCSAFSPIVAPCEVPWGRKAFGAYLGDDDSLWKRHDACELIRAGHLSANEILIDQGLADNFLENQLQTHRFEEACKAQNQAVNIRMQPGYDHSYFFIATFIDDHLRFHHAALTAS